MPKRIIPLTDAKIVKTKPLKKPRTLFDGDGLYLLITPTGGRLWRFKYRINGKGKLLAIGAYPAISLADARERRAMAKKQLANGIDPAAVKQARKQVDTEETETFEVIAREWHTKFSASWAPSHADTTISRMERDLFPWIGKRPISKIKAPELLGALRRVESRGALESARRLKIIAGQVFRYAVATGRAERDPSADLKGALAMPREKHYAAIIDPKQVAPLLRALDGYQGHFVVKCALRLSPLLFVRPGELRHAEWEEIDLDEAVWNIPASKMKMRDAHLVPLSNQAVDILRDLQPLTGTSRYVFPSARSVARPMLPPPMKDGPTQRR